MNNRSPWIHVADAALIGLAQSSYRLDLCEVGCEYRTLGGLRFVQYTLHDGVEDEAASAQHGSGLFISAAIDAGAISGSENVGIRPPKAPDLFCTTFFKAVCGHSGEIVDFLPLLACSDTDRRALITNVLSRSHGSAPVLFVVPAVRAIEGVLLVTAVDGWICAGEVFLERLRAALGGLGFFGGATGLIGFGLRRRNASLQPEDIPSYVWPQLFAQNSVAFGPGFALNDRAVLRRNSTVSVEPWPDIASVLEAEERCERCLAAQDLRCALQRNLFRE